MKAKEEHAEVCDNMWRIRDSSMRQTSYWSDKQRAERTGSPQLEQDMATY